MNKIFFSTSENNYRIIFALTLLIAVLVFSINKSYLLFHTVIELLSVVVAFTVFVITWNAKKILDNKYLYFVGVAYLFIGSLDLLHTLTFSGMNIVESDKFYANQFWIATRSMEALTLVIGFYFLNRKAKINADLLFLSYFVATVLIALSILYWHNFPVCFIEGEGQTLFKIVAEYVIIAILCLAGYLLYLRKQFFDPFVFKLLASSIGFTVFSEFSFTLYIDNSGTFNAVGHFLKLVSFYLIYKANVETGFTKPTTSLFNGIKESEIRYRTLANNLPVLIFRFNEDLECTFTNAMERGISKELQDLIFGKIKPALIKAGNLGLANQSTNVSFTSAGHNFSFSLTFILESQLTRQIEQSFLVLCQDITELKLAEEQLTDLNATKDRFLSIIAHDLKNPFTTILGANELIAKNADKLGTEKVKQLATRSYESAKNAYSLLENLLSWSMVQTGVLKPNFESVDVDLLLAQIVRSMNPTASLKGIDLELVATCGLYCYADVNMVNTVLRNLVSNAIKFSFTDSAIKISCSDDGQLIKFSVEDQGVGIEEKNLIELLSDEKVTSKDGTAKEKGTGLGLQLCKDFIRLNGGNFGVKSVVSKGSTFEFWLPKAG